VRIIPRGNVKPVKIENQVTKELTVAERIRKAHRDNWNSYVRRMKYMGRESEIEWDAEPEE
jgi:hypothetical protein